MTDLAQIVLVRLPGGLLRMITFNEKSVEDERVGTDSMMLREVERLSKRLKSVAKK